MTEAIFLENFSSLYLQLFFYLNVKIAPVKINRNFHGLPRTFALSATCNIQKCPHFLTG